MDSIRIIEIGNLEAPSIVIVDHLVDRVEGIEVRRQKMTRGCFPEYAKAIIDSGVATKWLDVDLEENWPYASRCGWAPTWW